VNADTRNAVLAILKKCRTLDEADKALLKVSPIPSRSLRWGLFDGFVGRPRTVTLLDGQNSGQVRADYLEGCEIGRELSMRRLPS
jgi:hypothetical protein